MHHHYKDIVSRIKEDPVWWDENAVPRYCQFTPRSVADIYCTSAALVLIECQDCGTEFRVAFSWNDLDFWSGERAERPTVETIKHLHYGDPPNTGCCAAGPTMNSVPRKVLEFWSTHHKECTEEKGGMTVCTEGYFDWRRDAELEIEINCEWAEEA